MDGQRRWLIICSWAHVVQATPLAMPCERHATLGEARAFGSDECGMRSRSITWKPITKSNCPGATLLIFSASSSICTCTSCGPLKQWLLFAAPLKSK